MDNPHGYYQKGDFEFIYLKDKEVKNPDHEHALLAYMYLQVGEEEIRRVVSAVEAEYLEGIFAQNTAKKEEITKKQDLSPLPSLLTDESAPFFISYGVIVPQARTRKWGNHIVQKLLKSFKGKYLHTVHLSNAEGAFATFVYADFFCDYELRMTRNIPCAFLMRSSADYPEMIKKAKKDPYYLGIALSPAFSNVSVADSILNRDFVIVIRDTEPVFDGNKRRWKKCISDEKMLRAARLI